MRVKWDYDGATETLQLQLDSCQRMGKSYFVTFDASIKTKQELFAAVTDTAYLGYSSITNWDAFEELLNERLECDIELTILIKDISGLPARDQQIFAEVFQDAAKAHPGKLILQQPSSSPRT